MPQKVDLLGQRFGSLVVTRECPVRTSDGKVQWICDCDCGGEHVASGRELRAGKTKRCSGCHHEWLVARGRELFPVTHGMTNAPEYRVWASMRDRCTNSKLRSWADYGGRGVTVCDRWLNSFEAFYGDMGPRPSPKHSIDRINVDGNYEPGNCRWATPPEQARNRTDNVLMQWNGEWMCQGDAAKAAGLTVAAVIARRKRGWPDELLLAPMGTRFVSHKETGRRACEARLRRLDVS